MRLIDELNAKIREINCAGVEWRALSLVTRFYIRILCRLIEKRLGTKVTKSEFNRCPGGEYYIEYIETNIIRLSPRP